MADGWWTLGGVVIGGAIGIASTVLLEGYRADIRAEQVAHAIAGEISALMDLVRARGYEAALADAAQRNEQGERIAFSFRAGRKYLATIEANLESIGMLPGMLPVLIPRFHVVTNSFLEDIDVLSAIDPAMLTAPDLAQRHHGALLVLKEAFRVGSEIVMTVAAAYGSPGYRSHWTAVRLWLRRRRPAPQNEGGAMR